MDNEKTGLYTASPQEKKPAKRIIIIAAFAVLLLCIISAAVITSFLGKGDSDFEVGTNAEISEKNELSFLSQELTLRVGDESELLINKNVFPGDLKWLSSDTSVAKIENGKVCGVGEGTAQITVQLGEKSATCKVTVKAAETTVKQTTETATKPSEKETTTKEEKETYNLQDEKNYPYAQGYIGQQYNVTSWDMDKVQTAINELLARNHYKFQNDDWTEYFSQYSWYYYNTTDMSEAESRFNNYERANYDYLIKCRTSLENVANNTQGDYYYTADEKTYPYGMYYVQDKYDISIWSDDEIQTAINELLARNHYKFQNDAWTEYFSQYPWYSYDTTDMSEAESRFNSIERDNYDFLAKKLRERQNSSVTTRESRQEQPFYAVICYSSVNLSVVEKQVENLQNKGFSAEIIQTKQWSNLNHEANYYLAVAQRCTSKQEAQRVVEQAKKYYSDAYWKETGSWQG